jgi:photosystem II stability/assembly factor-like uncharacterized protein
VSGGTIQLNLRAPRSEEAIPTSSGQEPVPAPRRQAARTPSGAYSLPPGKVGARAPAPDPEENAKTLFKARGTSPYTSEITKSRLRALAAAQTQPAPPDAPSDQRPGQSTPVVVVSATPTLSEATQDTLLAVPPSLSGPEAERYQLAASAEAPNTITELTWRPRPTGITQWLRGICGAASGELCAVGEAGTILLSEDDGQSWQKRPPITRRHLSGIATHGQTLCAVGEAGVVLVSQDGGRSWQERQSPTDQWLWGIFCSGGTFYAVGEGGTILASADGGASWQRRESNVSESLYAVGGNAAGVLYAVGRSGLYLISADGKSWIKRRGGALPDLQAVLGEARGQLYFAGRDGALLSSQDGGVSLTGQDSGVIACLNGLWLDGSDDLFAVGDGGTILRSRDGESWTPEPSGISYHLYGIWGSPTGALYAVGRKGALLRRSRSD